MCKGLTLKGISINLFSGKIKQSWLRICPDAITHVQIHDPVAALTFDDGPHPVYTPMLLRVLEEHDVHATFFMLGELAKKYPEIVRMVAGAGHIIGNHSWGHHNLTQVRSRFDRLRRIAACARVTAPYGKRLFRPPYGAYNNQMRLDALILRYKIILWSVSAQDWRPQSSEEIAQKITDRIIPGSIFLLHDAISDGKSLNDPRDRSTMLDGLEIALPILKERINFVTVPELLKRGKAGKNWPRYSEQ